MMSLYSGPSELDGPYVHYFAYEYLGICMIIVCISTGIRKVLVSLPTASFHSPTMSDSSSILDQASEAIHLSLLRLGLPLERPSSSSD